VNEPDIDDSDEQLVLRGKVVQRFLEPVDLSVQVIRLLYVQGIVSSFMAHDDVPEVVNGHDRLQKDDHIEQISLLSSEGKLVVVVSDLLHDAETDVEDEVEAEVLDGHGDAPVVRFVLQENCRHS